MYDRVFIWVSFVCVISQLTYCSCHYREEELQLKKRKQRKIKGSSRLSFADDIENGSEEEDAENGTFIFSELKLGAFWCHSFNKFLPIVMIFIFIYTICRHYPLSQHNIEMGCVILPFTA